MICVCLYETVAHGLPPIGGSVVQSPSPVVNILMCQWARYFTLNCSSMYRSVHKPLLDKSIRVQMTCNIVCMNVCEHIRDGVQYTGVFSLGSMWAFLYAFWRRHWFRERIEFISVLIHNRCKLTQRNRSLDPLPVPSFLFPSTPSPWLLIGQTWSQQRRETARGGVKGGGRGRVGIQGKG